MPKDPVALVSDAISKSQGFTQQAEELLRRKRPQMFEKTTPNDVAVREESIRNVALEMERRAAKGTSGVAGFGKSLLASRPSTALDTKAGAFLETATGIGPESLGTGTTISENLRVLPPALGIAATGGLGNAGRLRRLFQPASGAASGGALAQGARELFPVRVQGKDPNNPLPSSRESFLNVAREAAKEGAFELGGGLAGEAITGTLRFGARFLRGDEKFFNESLDALQRAGIERGEVGLYEVSNRSLISSAPRTIGVLPLFVGKFIRAKERSSRAVRRVQSEMFEDVSPMFSMIMEMAESNPKEHARRLKSMNEKFFKNLDGVVSKYRAKRASVKGAVDDLIRVEGLVSDAASTRLTASSILFEKRSGSQSLPNTGRGKNAKPISSSDDDTVIGFIEELKGIDEQPPLGKMVALKRELSKRLDDKSLSDGEIADLTALKMAVQEDIEAAIEIRGSDQLKAAMEDLAELDGDYLTLMFGQAGKRAKRTQTSFGKRRLSESGESLIEGGAFRDQGTRDVSTFVDDFLSNASPGEVRQMHALMKESGPEGSELFRAAAARRLDQALQAGRSNVLDADIEVLDPGKIRSQLGFDDKHGKKFQAFTALMQESGTSVSRVEALLNVADRIFKEKPQNANVFLSRKFVLAGGNPATLLKALTASSPGAAATAAGGAFGGGLTIVAGLFAMERFSQLAVSPKALKLVTQILDPKFGSGVKARAAQRLISNDIFRDWFQAVMTAEQTAQEMAEGLSLQLQNATKTIGNASQTVNNATFGPLLD